MEKRIAYYMLYKRGDVWNDAIERQFSKYMSKYGVIYFEEGSEKEIEFQKICSSRSINVIRHTIWKCSGKDLFRHPFHYLPVKEDKFCYDENSFMDYGNACGGGGKLLCKTNAIQINKVTIDLKKSKKLDIMTVPNIHKPKIYLISKKLKKIIEKMNFTGYKLIPCLEKGKQYSESEIRIDFDSKKVVNETKYFQLVITRKVFNPPCEGHIVRIFSQCEECKTIYGCFTDSTPYFKTEDLVDSDFQLYNEFKTMGGQCFTIPGDIVIISSKVLRMLIENKITGLTNYLTDPPIKHGVVEIGNVKNFMKRGRYNEK